MKTSAAGRDAITAREGRRLIAYLDSQGVATIGVGHTGRMAPPAVHLGMTITAEQCDAFLAADLAPVEAAINGLGTKLAQNQFDALASFAFNVGVPGFLGSSVAARVKAGRMPEAADALLMWEKPAELKARREAERKQFLTPDAPVKELGHSASKNNGLAAKTASEGLTPHPTATPAAAQPSAPAAAVRAHPAAEKAPSMSTAAQPVAKAALNTSSVNVLAGAINLVENVVSGLASSLKAKASSTTAGAVQAASNGNAIVGSISDGEAAISDVRQAISDAKAGKWGNEPGDVIDFLKHVFAILARFGVNVPVVSAIVSALPDMPAVA